MDKLELRKLLLLPQNLASGLSEKKLRNLGSIHSDVWHGTAADLAERDYIAVYPVICWWRERPKFER